jgi:hypothetical protein
LLSPACSAIDPPPDLGIARVGELIDFNLSHFHISRGAP